jgi:hypothetical protein
VVEGARDEQHEWIVPFPAPKAHIPDATHFRSTWLTASQAAVREHGLGAAYEAALDPALKDLVLSTVAGVWLPMPVARAHYAACNALALPTHDLLAMGMAATRRANATTLSFVARLAQGAGATPWTILEQGTRLWERTCRGGAVGIRRLGPKEAQCEVVGYPLADLTYNRVTFRGIVSAVVELFCQKGYVREVPRLCDERSLGFRLSWV